MTQMFDSLEQIVAHTCGALRPSERLTVSQAAEKYRYLNNPGSYVGPWDNTIAPYLVEPMDTLTSLDFTGEVFVGPARTGKSDMFFNWLGHTVVCDPADMMFIAMTQNTARDWSMGDLRKVFRHSPEIGKAVTPGRQNMNVHDVRFLNGMRMLVKWPTITELSGKTMPRLWLADYDRMPPDVDKEGSPFFLAQKRSETFGRFGMTVAESSPGYSIEDPKWKANSPHEAPPTPGILTLYNRGDRRRWYWPCPSCDEYFEPDFSLLKWPDTKDHMEAAEACYLVCPHCGHYMHHDSSSHGPGKNELNQSGKWAREGERILPNGKIVGQGRRSDIASFWLKGPAAAFSTWKKLVFNYRQALEDFENTGSEENLKTTVNVDQGMPYMPRALALDRLPEDLKARARDLGEREVPEGVRTLLACVDVQANRFVVQIHGFGEGGDIWVIDRFTISKSARLDEDGDPLPCSPAAYLEDWKLLIDQVMMKSYPLADGSGRHMAVKATACDSGGKAGTTKNAYDFYRYLRDATDLPDNDLFKRFHLVKGSPNRNAPRVQLTYPDSERKDRHANARGEIPVILLNSNMLKDQADAVLTRDKPGGGMVNFPKWLADWFYKELVAERRTEKGWENPRKERNEAWDLLTYAIALSIYRPIAIDKIDWSDPPSWAAPWDQNDFVFELESNKPFTSQPKSEYNLSELAERLA